MVIFTYGQLFAFVAGRFHSWLSFSYICIHGQSFTFVAGHLHLWLVICICRWSVSLYIVVGSGGRVVVVVGGLVLWLLWWLMEERKNVTHCDIRVMFKLTCEIT